MAAIIKCVGKLDYNEEKDQDTAEKGNEAIGIFLLMDKFGFVKTAEIWTMK